MCNLHGTINSPSLAEEYPQAFSYDVVERAKTYIDGLGGGVGAYSNSQGISAVREVRCKMRFETMAITHVDVETF